jgi:hypothetical protein
VRLAFACLLLVSAACVTSGNRPGPSCGDGDTTCLQGTVTLQGFTATPQELQASLFREFPATGTTPLQTIPLDPNGAWVFDGLDPWAHYFVEIVADFGQPQAEASFVGPLEVPSSGAPVASLVKPAQLTVLAQAASGMAQEVESAAAFLFDPATGAPLQGATVSIAIGGTAVAMPWTSIPGSPTDGYYASFSPPVTAQATYTITATTPGGSSPSTWQLVAGSASFSPVLTAPMPSTTVPANQPLTVAWPAQPMADEELVQLYTMATGGWSPAWELAAPLDEDATTATIPGSYVSPSGQMLLVNVAFLQASCPATADGCVVGEVIAPAQITAQ